MTDQDLCREELLKEIETLRERVRDLEAGTAAVRASDGTLSSSRTSAVAEWSYGLCHQLNDIHQVILGSAGSGLFNLGFAKRSEVELDLERILKSCRYAAQLVRRLQYFTGITWEEAETNTTFSASDLVRQAVQLSQYWWSIKPEMEGRAILLTRDIAEDCFVHGDENKLFEALINAVRMAAESLVLGGEVAVSLRVKDRSAVLSVASSMGNREQEGVDARKEPSIPQPCIHDAAFVEHRPGVGCCGGELSVRTSDDGAVQFLVKLPVATRPVEGEESESRHVPQLHGEQRILVVDDERFIVRLLEERLSSMGHTVFTASNGTRAMEIFRETPMDLVISDLVMSGMDGWQLAEQIRVVCLEKGIPKTPVIILTARHRRIRGGERMAEACVDAVLDKPIDFQELLETAATLLQRDHTPQARPESAGPSPDRTGMPEPRA